MNFGNSDRRIYFWVVTVLLIMDWAHTALSCYTIYLWLVQHFGDVAYLAISPWCVVVRSLFDFLGADLSRAAGRSLSTLR